MYIYMCLHPQAGHLASTKPPLSHAKGDSPKDPHRHERPHADPGPHTIFLKRAHGKQSWQQPAMGMRLHGEPPDYPMVAAKRRQGSP